MTPEQEDLLLMVARIVLDMVRQQPTPMSPPAPVEPDEYARECSRLLGELRVYDQPTQEPSAK